MIDNNTLFLLKNKIADDVTSCVFDEDIKRYKVTYGTDVRVYCFARNNVKILTNPEIIDTHSYKFAVKGGNSISDIQSVLLFDNKYYRVVFNTKYTTYHADALIIGKNLLADATVENLFDYYVEVATIFDQSQKPSQSQKSDSENGMYLSKQFEKERGINNSSVLANFLNAEVEHEDIPQNDKLIFPFGCNQSQIQAVDNALNSQVSIIEGPPGTGKTQTILNIIANILLEGKNVAIVSNNNDATNNVFEKLEKYGFAYTAAKLGNFGNKKEFFSNGQLAYPEFAQDILEESQFLLLMNDVVKLKIEIAQMLEKQNKIAVLEREFASLETEKKYFDDYFSLNYHDKQIFRTMSKQSSKNMQRLWVQVQDFLENEKKIGFWFKLKTIVRDGIKSFAIYKEVHDAIIPYVQKNFYELKIKEIRQEILECKTYLNNYHFDNKSAELTDKSLQILKASLAKKYSDKVRTCFEEKIIWETPRKFIKEYPIVLSTTHALKKNLNNFYYDYVIVDEASQADLVTGVLAMSCAKRMVIVGDLKQLPNIISNDSKKIITSISNQRGVGDSYQVEKHSLLSSICAVFAKSPKVLLREHYRCHPKIIDFCNKKFYNNQLIIMTEDKAEADVLMVYMTAPGNHARGRLNQRQIDEIKSNILPELNSNDVGIIAPYNMQKDELMKELQNQELISTVHKFQGREKDDIILSTVDNEITEFTDNANMLNVAVSRAKNRLRLVVSDNEKNDTSNIGDLIKYIKYHNFEVKHSDIYSVFDMLYKGYEAARKKYLKKRKKVSKYDSENLMHSVIEDVLAMEEFAHLSVGVHVGLNTLIQNLSILSSAEEVCYVKNPATHVDFLIFNTMDNSPLLAIEVDGHQFHKSGTRQSERDKMKDNIFEKYKIPIMRFKTTDSKEGEKLVEKLKALLAT